MDISWLGMGGCTGARSGPGGATVNAWDNCCVGQRDAAAGAGDKSRAWSDWQLRGVPPRRSFVVESIGGQVEGEAGGTPRLKRTDSLPTRNALRERRIHKEAVEKRVIYVQRIKNALAQAK
ncbi:hypothetical protein T484DRAFT_2684347 [Baffinella frigidus]|nr:hypothetical protein T484DRAFT_2684347 [Cryptophyta sp. CCMP2293]